MWRHLLGFVIGSFGIGCDSRVWFFVGIFTMVDLVLCFVLVLVCIGGIISFLF